MTRSNIETFYSSVPVETWKKVLGPHMHYHFGRPHAFIDPFQNAVLELCQFIPRKATVLDCGCGWGGPARFLMKWNACEVVGVTLSRQQADYIDDFEVMFRDMRDLDLNERHFDVALFMESFTHLDEMESIFSNLAGTADSIVIRDFIATHPFRDDRWLMNFRTENDFRSALTSAGYEVLHYGEEFGCWKPSVDIWLERINALPKSQIAGQIDLLRRLCLGLKAGQAGDVGQCTVHAVRR
jgi:hypothetical protein